MAEFESTGAYRRYLESLASEVEDPRLGFFGPRGGQNSMAWRINREGILSLGALRALLMQVAHPKVAQGIADHSNYARKPLARAYKTLKAQQVIIFGTCDEAIEALVRIYARHEQVGGQLPPGATINGNPEYRANDPVLKLWVYATLIDSVIRTHNTFLSRLSYEDEEQLYQESRLFARLMGIPVGLIPPTKQAFDDWMEAMLENGEIAVTKEGKSIAASLLRLPLPVFWPVNYLLAAGSLPPNIRAAFGIAWTRNMQTLYHLGVRLVSVVSACLPSRLRTTPAYLVAMRRLRETP
jgi:uncharacterized protein (DUF2236 family)